MTPRVREKLMLQDYKLDNQYETIKVKMSKNVTEEVAINPNTKTRGKNVTRTEQPGKLLSGVNRSIILAFVEDVNENYENLRIIHELLQMDQLSFVA